MVTAIPFLIIQDENSFFFTQIDKKHILKTKITYFIEKNVNKITGTDFTYIYIYMHIYLFIYLFIYLSLSSPEHILFHCF